jgi:APA family basic amino acid/polyamine antiporter
VNVLGLRTGAFAQNFLTILKVSILLAIGVGAFLLSGRVTPMPPPVEIEPTEMSWMKAFMLALLPAFWPYTGATDSVRLAEEVKDVNRALPRALFGTVAVLTLVYCVYNYALLCALSPSQMAGEPSVHALVFARLEGYPVRELILIASILICLGSISAVFLANVRVTYALARDGLTFRFLSYMSRAQSPVASFLVVGLIACVFVLKRSFAEILSIYFLASAFLFGLTYLSLIVFRLRDRRPGGSFPAGAYRAPVGVLQAVLLILLELAIAGSIVAADARTWLDREAEKSYDSLYTLALLAVMAGFYAVWKRLNRPGTGAGGARST